MTKLIVNGKITIPTKKTKLYNFKNKTEIQEIIKKKRKEQEDAKS